MAEGGELESGTHGGLFTGGKRGVLRACTPPARGHGSAGRGLPLRIMAYPVPEQSRDARDHLRNMRPVRVERVVLGERLANHSRAD